MTTASSAGGEAANATEGKTIDDDNTTNWIHLTEGKQFSRLLYTNPVCFLSTSDSCTKESNVMVLSWLTATNNHGRFLFSINKRRHTASLLEEGSHFCLSVPVQGMENLVLEVGRASGRWGSKFGLRHGDCKNSAEAESAKREQPLESSKRKKKRRTPVVDGLKGSPLLSDGATDGLDAVENTVAQMLCKTCSIMKDAPHLVDDDHYLVSGQVEDAHVLSSHWNPDKNLFQPQRASARPYLTFFGSQTFGYVERNKG